MDVGDHTSHIRPQRLDLSARVRPVPRQLPAVPAPNCEAPEVPLGDYLSFSKGAQPLTTGYPT
jgi:hypothetical protein